MRALIERAYAHGELLAAVRTKVPARPHRLAAKRLDGRPLAAAGAYSTIRPARCLKKFAGFGFVSKGWVGDVAHGGLRRRKPPYTFQLVQSST